MAKKLRSSITSRAAGFLRDWSIPRQMAGQSVNGDAAKSTLSKTLRPRLEEADRVGTSICPFCAIGCSQLIYAKNGKPIHIEGDPRSPINQGTLCPKGAGTLGALACTAGRRVVYSPLLEARRQRAVGPVVSVAIADQPAPVPAALGGYHDIV